jgi:hypothetical protein
MAVRQIENWRMVAPVVLKEFNEWRFAVILGVKLGIFSRVRNKSGRSVKIRCNNTKRQLPLEADIEGLRHCLHPNQLLFDLRPSRKHFSAQ